METLRVTPAMAAGISDKLWSTENIVAKIAYYRVALTRTALRRAKSPGPTTRLIDRPCRSFGYVTPCKTLNTDRDLGFT